MSTPKLKPLTPPDWKRRREQIRVDIETLDYMKRALDTQYINVRHQLLSCQQELAKVEQFQLDATYDEINERRAVIDETRKAADGGSN